jgi:molybdopterin-guanine dinucleotide biosynthesis protein A
MARPPCDTPLVPCETYVALNKNAKSNGNEKEKKRKKKGS